MTDGDDNELPRDPFADMAAAASSMHDMYVSMRASGFTELEACRIIGVMLATAGSGS